MSKRTLMVIITAMAVGCGGTSTTNNGPAANAAGTAGTGDKDGIEVRLCDNKTTTTVAAGTEMTRDQGQKIADALMSQWQLANRDRQWETDVARAHPAIPPPADNRGVIAQKHEQGQAYGTYTERDVLTWTREIERLVLEGAGVFHDGDALGSTIAVSCDMCHPDAANTHPETYPKFQVQLGRVVLLRDMINWCLQHPVRAEPMEPDDPRMRAMEAYILAQRKGKTLDYGKH